MPHRGLYTAILVIFFFVATLTDARRRNKTADETSDRENRFLSVFQIVSFPNDPCSGSGSKNGTCYTAAECSSKSGVNAGTCAQGFGVCCTFTLNCGGTTTENCTYFESQGSEVGACKAKICKCSSNICQIRLDFNSFVISGPSTATQSSQTTKFGMALTGGTSSTTMSQCLTDTFVALNPGGSNPPTICGTNSGEHMYLDASDCCNDLVFQLGANGVGTAFTMRQWSIKITQYSCDYNNLAPTGCTQYFFGNDVGTVQTFNFAGGQHLANQDQRICVRRERGNCRICWTAMANTDFATSGTKSGSGVVAPSCCGYDSMGVGTKGYDCVVIPGARKTTTASKMALPTRICGRDQGLVTATGMMPKTICSYRAPFDISFLSNNYEMAAMEAMNTNQGFRLTYIQSAQNCP